MASIVLSTVGSAIGGSVGGPIGAFIGSQIGRTVGSMIDNSLFGSGGSTHHEGPRLADLAVQSSTYGKMIPIVYGTARIAGNVIWSRPIKETATTTTVSSGGKGSGGKVSQSATAYSYSASLAIAVCEGPVDEVLRVWADAKQIDLGQGVFRFYKGDEVQGADSLMESFEGTGNVPGYRGLAYIVIEDFPLGDFGNRIPNFTFEVRRKLLGSDANGEPVENLVTAVTLIPGAGEFVYDTQIQMKVPGVQVGASWVQQGSQSAINLHNPSGKANALLSLDQLALTLPNVEWVSVVVTWFGDDLDAGACVLEPGVEYQTGATTSPDAWSASSFTRATARQITLVDGSPRYGGTPSDASVTRLLTELRARGYKIMFYPMPFMDISGKPWRGHLTGSAANVASFFTKTNGYNAFINHYVSLVAGKVDAFAIGSELKGLTSVTDTPGNYPAVNALVSLAATVKTALGSGVKVTYAADWSEYHHTDGGWYNLDPLWASANIDVIGIDAYFPLTSAPQNGYDVAAVQAGWTSGEGYDFYYTDGTRTTTAPLGAAYAWKNIAWFWSNTHYNPGGAATSWVPMSKKIWLTEYGFPSVDGAANQPNVFYDPASSDGGFPYFSRGRMDFRAQRIGIAATEAQWAGSAMVERKFLWTWDARPYPYWPDLLEVWGDGAAWPLGHWVQGKLGLSNLGAIVAELCRRCGLSDDDFDVAPLTERVEGFIIIGPGSARGTIEQLQAAYFFDAVESDGVLRFVPRGGAPAASIDETELLPRNSAELFTLTRAQEMELPQQVNVVYLNRFANYQQGSQLSQRLLTESTGAASLALPLVCNDQEAKRIADVTLFSVWLRRTSYQFDLPPKYALLEPSDCVQVSSGGETFLLRLLATQWGASGVLRVEGVAEDNSVYDFYTLPGIAPKGATPHAGAAVPTKALLLDLPSFPGDNVSDATMRIAATGLGAGWKGAALYRSDDGGAGFARVADIPSAAAIGTATAALGNFSGGNVFDYASSLTVALLGEATLESVTELAVLNGANAAMLGGEVLQFTTATLVEPGKYVLSGFLRGRLGSESFMGGHAAGEDFVLLDGRVARLSPVTALIGVRREYKAVSFGDSLGATLAQDFTYGGRALQPLSPVQVSGSRDGAGNLSIAWIRRSRGSAEWRDGADVPLNEASESYEVEIMHSGVVVRILSGLTSPSGSYSAAQQVSDFGSAQNPLTVRIYQISASVGRSYPQEAVI